MFNNVAIDFHLAKWLPHEVLHVLGGISEHVTGAVVITGARHMDLEGAKKEADVALKLLPHHTACFCASDVQESGEIGV
jgi:hypothetical protein